MLYTAKKILVTTDFSEQSDLALKAAESIRRVSGGTIDLLYVSDLGMRLQPVITETLNNTFQKEFYGQFRHTWEEKMKEQASRCGAQVRVMLKEGNVAESILETTKGGSNDLLVMGHGGKGFFEQLMGSVTSKVVTASEIPVLVVKKEFVPGKVAGLVDDDAPMDRIINQTFDFYRNSKAQSVEFITMAEKKTVGSKIEGEVKHFTHDGENPIVHVEQPRAYNVAYDLVDVLNREHVDIAILKRNNGLVPKRLFLGSVSAKLLDSFTGNLVVYPS